ncbi:unnamed protein product [Acidithrix sp. C25]|nr:unnamed protein product [Acidithrix sp. C25]
MQGEMIFLIQRAATTRTLMCYFRFEARQVGDGSQLGDGSFGVAHWSLDR